MLIINRNPKSLVRGYCKKDIVLRNLDGWLFDMITISTIFKLYNQICSLSSTDRKKTSISNKLQQEFCIMDINKVGRNFISLGKIRSSKRRNAILSYQTIISSFPHNHVQKLFQRTQSTNMIYTKLEYFGHSLFFYFTAFTLSFKDRKILMQADVFFRLKLVFKIAFFFTQTTFLNKKGNGEL